MRWKLIAAKTVGARSTVEVAPATVPLQTKMNSVYT